MKRKPSLSLVPSEAEIAARRMPQRRWWHRFRREKPTTFHRCLAVHMAGARPTSALR